MNPALVRELDAEGAAIVRLINDIPRGREHDMTGHIDAKRVAMRRLERLMQRVRQELCGAASRPSDLFSGPVKIARQRVRRVEREAGR